MRKRRDHRPRRWWYVPAWGWTNPWRIARWTGSDEFARETTVYQVSLFGSVVVAHGTEKWFDWITEAVETQLRIEDEAIEAGG